MVRLVQLPSGAWVDPVAVVAIDKPEPFRVDVVLANGQRIVAASSAHTNPEHVARLIGDRLHDLAT